MLRTTKQASRRLHTPLNCAPYTSWQWDGAWAVQLAAFPAGTDGVLTVKGADKKDDKGKPVSGTVTFKDVLVGEVWVCSGQSNMEWSLASSPKGGG